MISFIYLIEVVVLTDYSQAGVSHLVDRIRGHQHASPLIKLRFDWRLHLLANWLRIDRLGVRLDRVLD